MNFFVPDTTEENQEKVYQGIKKFACPPNWKTEDRRIFSISFVHEGVSYHAEVGQLAPRIGEIVKAIFDSDAYLICTDNQGVLRGDPYMIGREEARDIVYFDGYGSGKHP